MISDATGPVSSTSFPQGGTCRWMSPELFDPENFGLKDSRLTKHSDCYALGMLIYEVLSGQVPFFRHHGHPFTLGLKVLRGERPERPQGVDGTWFTSEVWSMLEHCWKASPGDRPRIEDVLRCLENASRSWIPPSSQTVVSALATDPLVRIFDSRTEESTDESDVSSPPQGVSSRPRRTHSKGDLNENHI